jgi:hypothetical protein
MAAGSILADITKTGKSSAFMRKRIEKLLYLFPDRNYPNVCPMFKLIIN